MNETIGNFSFHDLVTLLLPSALVITCVYYCWPNFLPQPISDSYEWVFYLAQFSILLIIGMTIKAFAKLAFTYFMDKIDIINKVWSTYRNSDACLNKGTNKIDTQTYYKKYYYVRKHTYCDDISIMEAHVSFLITLAVASVISIIILLITAWCCHCCCCCSCSNHSCATVLLLIVAIIACRLAFCEQRKCMQLVFENYDYLKELEDSQKKNDGE